jgi:chemotaxis protein MotB
MDKSDDTIDLDDFGKKRGSPIVPWMLFLAALGGGGYLYFAQHRPLELDGVKKDHDILDLQKQLTQAKKDAEAAKAVEDNLAKAQDQVKQMQNDLQRSTAEKSEDEKLLAELRKQVTGADVEGAEGAITVTMVDKILFKSGEAALTPAGEELLKKLGGVLASAQKLIEVSGHADNQPIESKVKQQFPTNWELSVARATNVVRFLQEKVGIKPRRLKAAGYGSSRPVASNATEKGRAKNRRIEILLLPDQIKVVKGDFADEVAAAAPVADAHKTQHAKKHK